MKRAVLLTTAVMLLLTGLAAADIPFEARTTLHDHYDPDQPVGTEQITGLLNAAFSMPTGGNQRALEFYVVTDRETLMNMKRENAYYWALETAPCVIVIAADTDIAFFDEILEADAGIAAGAILLQAADYGLCTCVLAVAPYQEKIQSVREALNLEETHQPILLVAVGYPDEDAVSGASVSNWNESQIYWNPKRD